MTDDELIQQESKHLPSLDLGCTYYVVTINFGIHVRSFDNEWLARCIRDAHPLGKLTFMRSVPNEPSVRRCRLARGVDRFLAARATTGGGVLSQQ